MIRKHFSLEEFNQENYRYYVEKPDPDFSPEHNLAVINETIDEYRKMRYGVADKVKAASEDRADILASFAKYKLDQGGEKKIEQFLGKERMNQIYGEKLLEKLRIFESTKRLNKARKNTKFEEYYLT